eukprot:3510506-Amphidinium_carterae.1
MTNQHGDEKTAQFTNGCVLIDLGVLCKVCLETTLSPNHPPGAPHQASKFQIIFNDGYNQTMRKPMFDQNRAHIGLIVPSNTCPKEHEITISNVTKLLKLS